MSSARRLYRLHLGLALLGGSAALAASATALTRVRPGVPSPSELLAACREVVPPESGLGLLVVLLLLALGLAVACRGAGSLWRHLGAQRRALRAFRVIERRRIAGVPVTVIDAAAPTAFCAGLLRPRVYLSAAALMLLRPDEMAAVVAHEEHHRAQRDPLRILTARILADALFFLPALGRTSERYRQLAELAADEAAALSGGTSALASALLRFGERGGVAAPVVGIAPERVEHLLGEAPRWQLPISVLSGSLVVVVGLLGLALTAPTLLASESVGLATILAESCMVAMLVAPLALGAGALWLSRSWIRRRLPVG